MYSIRDCFPPLIIAILTIWIRIQYLLHSSYLPNDIEHLRCRWPDEGTYFNHVQAIQSHGVKAYLVSPLSFNLLPGNPLYLAGLYELCGRRIFRMRLCNILLSTVTLLLVYAIGKKIFGRAAGVCAALLCTVCDGLIVLSPTILTEPLYFFAFIAALYFLVELMDPRPGAGYLRQSICAGIFLGAGGLTRPILAALPVAIILACILVDAGRIIVCRCAGFHYTRRLLPACIIAIALVIPVPLKNRVCFGECSLFSKEYSGVGFWLGSRPDTEGDEPPYRGLPYGDHELRAQGRDFTRVAFQNIKEHPGGYIFWNIKKIGRLTVGSNLAWFFPHKSFSEWHRANHPGVKKTLIILLNVALSATVLAYGALGGIHFARDDRALFLFGIALFVIVGTIPFLVNQRYGYPVYLVNAVLASAMMLHLFREMRSHPVRCIIPMALVFAIVAYVASGV